jgi:hypothetical protein
LRAGGSSPPLPTFKKQLKNIAMAKIIKVDAYDIISRKTETRHINADNVIEIEEQLSYDGKPLTRIRMSNGILVDIQKTVDEITDIING